MYDNFTAEDMQNMNMIELQKSFAVDSFTSIAKCWWATKEFDCNGTFANRVLDQGYCSMFIPNKWLGNYIQNSGIDNNNQIANNRVQVSLMVFIF